MKKWEYTFEMIRDKITNQLNVYGQYGWELVAVVQPTITSIPTYYFKRELVENEPEAISTASSSPVENKPV